MKTTPRLFTALDAVSHDLKSPIASIISAISLIKLRKDTITTAEVLEYLERAEQKAYFLNENIDALFALGAIYEGTFTLEPTPLVLREVLEAAQRAVPEWQVSEVATELQVTGDAEWLSKALQSIFQHINRFQTELPQLTVQSSNSQVALEVTYQGERIWSRTNKTDEGAADPFELAAFLPMVNKEVRLSLYIAVYVLRELGGDLQISSAEDQQKHSWQILLPVAK